ncbi:MAG: flippase-like domain-containing protein [Candidatus Omnitrophica bacterium]|nr:flippase-like domain-containing protein [Candidatus Omnitrophota bacterium]
MKSNIKNVLSWVVRAGFSVLLLWFLFVKIVDVHKIVSLVKAADLKYLLYAFLVFGVINITLFFRWIVFIRALNLSTPWFQVMRFYMIGLFGNLFLPSAIGGDLIKIIGLCKDSDEKPKVVASVLLDRVSGFAGIALVAVISFAAGYRVIHNNFLLVPVGILFLGSLMVAVVLFNRKVYEKVGQVFNRMPKAKVSLMQMHEDIMLLRNKKTYGFLGIVMSALNQVVYSFNFFLIAKAFHVNIDILYFLLFVPLLCVVSMVPSFGGLGVREAGAAYLFGRIGVDSGVGVSISLMIFTFMVVAGLVGGAAYVVTLSSRRVQYHPSAAGKC